MTEKKCERLKFCVFGQIVDVGLHNGKSKLDLRVRRSHDKSVISRPPTCMFALVYIKSALPASSRYASRWTVCVAVIEFASSPSGAESYTQLRRKRQPTQLLPAIAYTNIPF